jgi:hypothetical protein
VKGVPLPQIKGFGVSPFTHWYSGWISRNRAPSSLAAAVSSLPALTALCLDNCYKVTAAGVQALRNTTAAPSLHITR